MPQWLWLRRNAAHDDRDPLTKVCDEVRNAPKQPARPVLVDVSDEVGLRFRRAVGPPGTYFLPEINGSGGAFLDYDNDGDLDIYLVNSGRSPRATSEFAEDVSTGNRLFRREADGRYSDVTEQAGVGDDGYGVGCAVGDFDNDGDRDIYLTNYGPDRLYENQGDGTFVDVGENLGLANERWATGAVFLDFDRDGWLDLFVVNYVDDPIHGHSVACDFGKQRYSYCGPLKFRPTADRLYRNLGPSPDGTHQGFLEVTQQAGLSDATGAGFTAVSRDFNKDGWPDLYVANDMEANRLWINQRNGTFQDEAVARGAAVNASGQAEASMGVACGDYDGDGDCDLIATHFTSETTTLYVNDGAGYFSDRTSRSSLAHHSRSHTGWGAALVDLDHDGDLDLPLVHGMVTPCQLTGPTDVFVRHIVRNDVIEDVERYWGAFVDRNLLFVNEGDGVLNDASSGGGDFTRSAGSGRALIYGDADNDGDVDLLVTYCHGPARLYRNDIPKSGRWLLVRPVERRRDAYGARVVIRAGGRSFYRSLSPADSYLASNDSRLHFGLGAVKRYDEIEVLWVDGGRERFDGGEADRVVILERGKGEVLVEAPR